MNSAGVVGALCVDKQGLCLGGKLSLCMIMYDMALLVAGIDLNRNIRIENKDQLSTQWRDILIRNAFF